MRRFPTFTSTSENPAFKDAGKLLYYHGIPKQLKKRLEELLIKPSFRVDRIRKVSYHGITSLPNFTPVS